jgi:hypothetical protein
MKRNDSLKKILYQTRPYWDRDETRPAARQAFRKALLCGTPALGAEVYASDGEEKIVYHTCKDRVCSSCGYRATMQWQRERWAALPDVPYKGITFTMPDVLWPLFRDNRHLLKALPALAASVLRSWVLGKHGIRVGVIVILHTFNGKLDFNSHVHTMVTAGGLQASSTWLESVYYDQDCLMSNWRQSVIRLLRAALQAGTLRTEMAVEAVEELLERQENRWWSVRVQALGSKEHFLRYAGRYARRPPIAQRRITHVDERSVTFWYKDKRLRRRVEARYSLEDFIDALAQHIPERYCHGVRSFGLLAPRALSGSSTAVFTILGQKRRPRPKPRPWAISILQDFKRGALLDGKGKRMKWVGRLPPNKSS